MLVSAAVHHQPVPLLAAAARTSVVHTAAASVHIAAVDDDTDDTVYDHGQYDYDYADGHDYTAADDGFDYGDYDDYSYDDHIINHRFRCNGRKQLHFRTNATPTHHDTFKHHKFNIIGRLPDPLLSPHKT